MATGAASAQRQAVPVRHRPNIDEMTAPQVERLREAFAALQQIGDDRGYATHAGYHGLPLPPECGTAHGFPGFLPWHRAYLYRFEQALRDTGHDVMLPWWDWTRTTQVPAAYAAETTATGDPNPLHSAAISAEAREQGERVDPVTQRWTFLLAESARTFRDPGQLRPNLPTAEEVELAMSESEYEGFRSEIEDVHGDVHIWVGGHMSNLAFASFDPIFWAHHCMIDRLWRIWQLENPEASFPTEVRGLPMEPFNLTAADVLDPTDLGYDYAISIVQVPATT